MRNRKFALVVVFLIAALTLGIGYAALTDNLTIIGNAHIDIGQANSTFDEKVFFSDAQATSSTGSGTIADAVSFTADDATYTVNKLATVGQKSVFTFTITNDSNVDAVISVADQKLSGTENPSNSNTQKFTVEYSYPDGMTVAKNGGTIDVVVTVTVKEPVTSATSATFGMELTATSVDP